MGFSESELIKKSEIQFSRVVKMNRHAITKKANGWYVDIRVEGLKMYRYGAFITRSKAEEFYRDTLESMESFLIVDIPCLPIRSRKLGKVCGVNLNPCPKEVTHGKRRRQF